MAHYEIVLPETKPETEWVRGRPLQKVSPQRTHSRLQGALTIRLDRWAAGRGEVGPEMALSNRAARRSSPAARPGRCLRFQRTAATAQR